MKIKKLVVRMLLTLIVIILLIPVVVYSFCPFSGPIYKGPVTDHFNGKEFHNIEKGNDRGFGSLIKWQFNRERGYWMDWLETEYGPKPADYAGNGDLLVTFVNHSTVLLQADSLNIITDPVYSYRVGPVSFAGPVRHRNPGIRFEDLPRIDVVMVSHNHYDHMDIPTLKRLYEKFKPLFLVSLGNKPLLEENGITNVVELDWWEDITVKEHKITFVPARHFSMRGTCDRNKTLWGGYVINTEGGPVYFAGDTGYGVHFSMIRERFGPMRFSMLPVGAYRPAWFMSDVHVSPEEAVKAHIELQSAQSMGIHFGTFAQADDGQFEPVRDTKLAIEKLNVSPRKFFVPYHGRAYNIPVAKNYHITR